MEWWTTAFEEINASFIHSSLVSRLGCLLERISRDGGKTKDEMRFLGGGYFDCWRDTMYRAVSCFDV